MRSECSAYRKEKKSLTGEDYIQKSKEIDNRIDKRVSLIVDNNQSLREKKALLKEIHSRKKPELNGKLEI